MSTKQYAANDPRQHDYEHLQSVLYDRQRQAVDKLSTGEIETELKRREKEIDRLDSDYDVTEWKYKRFNWWTIRNTIVKLGVTGSLGYMAYLCYEFNAVMFGIQKALEQCR